MVMIMKNFNELKKKLELALEKLQIKYDILTLNDEDLNYSIQVSTLGKLKILNSINCILYFDEDNFSMHLLVGNIYNIKKADNKLDIYRIINHINFNTPIGNFTIFGDDKEQIIYRSTVPCGKNFNTLDEELIKFMIIPFIISLEELINLLMKKGVQ